MKAGTWEESLDLLSLVVPQPSVRKAGVASLSQGAWDELHVVQKVGRKRKGKSKEMVFLVLNVNQQGQIPRLLAA